MRLLDEIRRQLRDPFFWFLLGIFTGTATLLILAMLFFKFNY